LFILLMPIAARAAGLPKPQVSIELGEEEKKKVVRATVTLDGKPLPDAAVKISVKRTFGLLPLGKDTTLDDGTAVAPFPLDLPGDADRQLQIVAAVAGTPKYDAAIALTAVPAIRAALAVPDPFPRALWAPHAPLELIVPIFSLLAGVWITYAFVVRQIIAIHKGGAQ
jgi:hypothetical protein